MERCCRKKDGPYATGDPVSGVEAFADEHKEAAHSRVAVGWGDCNDNPAIVPIVYKFPGSYGEGTCRRT
jgi:hypothetical protein